MENGITSSPFSRCGKEARERVALQGRFPATAEVKEVMAGKFVCFIFLRRLFTNLPLHPPHRGRPERGAAAGSAAVSAEGTAHDWPCTAASKQPQRRPPRTKLPPVKQCNLGFGRTISLDSAFAMLSQCLSAVPSLERRGQRYLRVGLERCQAGRRHGGKVTQGDRTCGFRQCGGLIVG